LVIAAVTGCAYGRSSGTPAPAPSHNNSDCGYSWNPCGNGGGPVASADAAPQGSASGCFLHVLNGVGIDGHDVVGGFSVVCNARPKLMTILARLQVLNSAGNWVDETGMYVYNAPSAGQPLPDAGVPQHHPVHDSQLRARCFTGTWRIEGHWAGVKGNGRPFPNPADGDTPADWSSAPVHFVC
jgi:hypothetical protein